MFAGRGFKEGRPRRKGLDRSNIFPQEDGRFAGTGAGLRNRPVRKKKSNQAFAVGVARPGETQIAASFQASWEKKDVVVPDKRKTVTKSREVRPQFLRGLCCHRRGEKKVETVV